MSAIQKIRSELGWIVENLHLGNKALADRFGVTDSYFRHTIKLLGVQRTKEEVSKVISKFAAHGNHVTNIGRAVHVFKSKQESRINGRFMSKVAVDDQDKCWLWTASVVTDEQPYGKFFSEKRQTRAHVFSYRLFKGQIPAGRIVCHTCDNPRCVNPAHLYTGTHQNNSDDSYSRKRDRWSRFRQKQTNQTGS